MRCTGFLLTFFTQTRYTLADSHGGPPMNPPGWSIPELISVVREESWPSKCSLTRNGGRLFRLLSLQASRSPCSSSLRSPQPMEPARKDLRLEVKQFPAGNGPPPAPERASLYRVSEGPTWQTASVLAPPKSQTNSGPALLKLMYWPSSMEWPWESSAW